MGSHDLKRPVVNVAQITDHSHVPVIIAAFRRFKERTF